MQWKWFGGLVLVLLLAAAVALACPVSAPCPVHDYSTGYYTGTQFIDGVAMGVYRCPRGHSFLVRCN